LGEFKIYKNHLVWGFWHHVGDSKNFLVIRCDFNFHPILCGREEQKEKMSINLRDKLVSIAIEWQESYGIAPQITTSISEYDAAMLAGFPEHEYSEYMQEKTAVCKGSDFTYKDIRYQVKGNRPSGKPGSRITMVPKAKNYDWDILIWVMYDKDYNVQEAWQWDVHSYKKFFHDKKRLSPKDYRLGHQLFPQATTPRIPTPLETFRAKNVGRIKKARNTD